MTEASLKKAPDTPEVYSPFPGGFMQLPWRNGGLLFTDLTGDIQVAQLQTLMHETFWGATRPFEQVRRILIGSTIALGVLEGEQLVAFVRAASDGAAYAWIFDMIVTRTHRQRGIASRLIQLLLNHPRLTHVPKIRLDTTDAKGFYEKFGFETIATGRPPYADQVTMELRREVSF